MSHFLYTIFSNLPGAMLYSMFAGAFFWGILAYIRKTNTENVEKHYRWGMMFQYCLFLLFIWKLLCPVYESKQVFTPIFNNHNINNLNNYISIIYIVLLTIKSVHLYIKNRSKDLFEPIENSKFEQLNTWLLHKIETLHIRQKIQLQVSKLAHSPYTKGWIKPIIVLPLSAINNLTTYQVEAILLHELSHIKHLDYMWNALQIIMETILYFNPFMIKMGKMIREDRELSCDKNVISNGYRSNDYISSLLFFYRNSDNHISAISEIKMTGNRNSEFYNRMMILLGKSNTKRSIWAIPSFILGLVGSIYLIGGISPMKETNDISSTYTNTKRPQINRITDGNNFKFVLNKPIEKIESKKLQSIDNKQSSKINNVEETKEIKAIANNDKVEIRKKSLNIPEQKTIEPEENNSIFSLAKYLPEQKVQNIRFTKKVIAANHIFYQVDYQNLEEKRALFNQLIQSILDQNTIVSTSVSTYIYANNENRPAEEKMIVLNTPESQFSILSNANSLQVSIRKTRQTNIN